MSRPGSTDNPLRVAIVGSGPAGFYAVQTLLKTDGLEFTVDMFDRLPTPFGLVRAGVAPDHQKIKSVIAVYDKLARDRRFRFFGNVTFGEQIGLDELAAHYHQIVFATGAQTDRQLGIPGEGLRGSHPATEFVAWYNGHPDFADARFDLSQERVVVVGVGNVAVDVARILCRSPEELKTTDISDAALEQLRASRVREVVMLGRRGPAQAAFSNAEIKELGELPDATTVAHAADLELDEVSAAAVADDRATARKVAILESYVGREDPSRQKRLDLRFLVSPSEIHDDGQGRVGGVTLVRNVLETAADGRVRCRPTEATERLDAGLVFRSVGYRGVPIPGVPFDESSGTVPNEGGRILADGGSEALPGLYVTGWIKRGPSGVIGTNKPDAVETVAKMLEDLESARLLDPDLTDAGDVTSLLRGAGVSFVSYDDWLRIDEAEVARGEAAGRPRVKFVTYAELAAALQA